MKEKLKKVLVSGLRLIVGFGVAAFLLNKVFDKDAFLEQVRQGSVPILVIVPILFGVILILTFIRWQRLLHVLEINLSFWAVFRLGMIGAFFNGSLPGAVSGDVVKVIYVRHHAPGKQTEAILTMFLDRVLGLFGLLTVAVIACALNFQALMRADDVIKLYAGFVGLASVAGMCGFSCMFFRKALMKFPGVTPLVAWFQKRLPEKVVAIFDRVADALDLYRGNLKAIGIALALSIVVHTLNAGMLIYAARGINENKVTTSEYFMTAQISNALASIPLSPGGTGVRESITKDFLVRLRPDVFDTRNSGDALARAKVAPILVLISMYFWYLIGGIFFVIGKVGASEEVTDDDEDGARPDSTT